MKQKWNDLILFVVSIFAYKILDAVVSHQSRYLNNKKENSKKEH